MTDANFTRPGAVDLSSLTDAAPTGGSYVTSVTEASFNDLAGTSMQHPVVVEFFSPRDPNGQQVSAALAELINAAQGRFLLGRVDVDAEPRLAQALGVQAVPTVVALIGGQMAPLFQGTKSREEISAVLDQIAQLAVGNGMTGRAQPVGGAPAGNGDAEQQPVANPRFAKADAALQAGDFAQAVREFDELLKETPHDAEVVAGRAQSALLERSATFNPAEIVARAAAQPDDVAAQLDAADLEIINGRYEEAFDRLLGLAAESDEEQRDAIRVRLLELFEVVGRTEKVVLKARRRLASVLF
ncbi:tetratricopeptide repeat protein [Tessaracoccus sp. MC1865]|uniref:tetratricopeptide repeat protein n=1 Tax=Tessaracoccus sp. MC1865 TaxID=2760310 RepID=UPI0016042F0E|nr:tetratricopeptide repeat protein [Tessaracoccus sp. MC1865]MBB1483437.1 tetratricopeptide repeat protein [Tessaracoccus sp. MC1865]QTO36539.1 tetratricopeptide repeat protein [Tessaracoccus sp. MC1865]